MNEHNRTQGLASTWERQHQPSIRKTAFNFYFCTFRTAHITALILREQFVVDPINVSTTNGCSRGCIFAYILMSAANKADQKAREEYQSGLKSCPVGVWRYAMTSSLGVLKRMFVN